MSPQGEVKDLAADAAARRIAELEAQVSGLEAALARRSRELRHLQDQLCRRDLVTLSRLSAGLPALARGAYEPELWRETAAFTEAEVDETLADLWRSLLPRGGEDPGDTAG
ncbi:MAG TPA: hypothetical protein VFE33_18195 [Thermoanaerobaculia bacterium]|nr:hypothetical protein [Thermoanaerobaculia bacterium]